MTTIAATGHRPGKAGDYGRASRLELTRLARQGLREIGATKIITGMALGWDQAVAMAAFLNGIPFTAAIPFPGQENRWPERSQRFYTGLVERAAEVVFVSDRFTSRAMQKRNEWMVDRADRMLALWDGNIGGGTANCIVYAERKGVPFTNMWRRYRGDDFESLL